MKRHTKLFEEFSQSHGLWAIMFIPDMVMYGLYDTEQEAIDVKSRIVDFNERIFKQEFGQDEEYIDEDLEEIERVFPGQSDAEDARLFNAAVRGGRSENYQEGFPADDSRKIVAKLILAGGNPFAEDRGSYISPAFDSLQELDEFLEGYDFSGLGQPNARAMIINTVKRTLKSKNLFGI